MNIKEIHLDWKDPEANTGASILKKLQTLYDSGDGLGDHELATLEKQEAEKDENPSISPYKWY